MSTDNLCFVSDKCTFLYCVYNYLSNDMACFCVLSSVVRDRVIACWFPDRLALAYGIAVSTMGLGSVLTFLLTSNIADSIGLTSTLFVGMFNYLIEGQ